jgi:hypothetical protein
MKLFYITATRLNLQLSQTSVVLTQETETAWESHSIERDLVFTDKPDLSTHLNEIAFFTSSEIEILMMIKNKEIPWGSKLSLKGKSVNNDSLTRLFDHVENVEIKEVTVEF